MEIMHFAQKWGGIIVDIEVLTPKAYGATMTMSRNPYLLFHEAGKEATSMKRTYSEPKANVVLLDTSDILTTSSGKGYGLGGATARDENWDVG